MLNASAVNARALNTGIASAAPTLLVEIFQGTTLVATRTLSGFTSVVAATEIVLTTEELALVTNPSDLTVRLTHQGGGVLEVTAATVTLTGVIAGTFFYHAAAASLAAATAVWRRTARRAGAILAASGVLRRMLERGVVAFVTGSAAQTRRSARRTDGGLTGMATTARQQARGQAVVAALTPSALVTRVQAVTQALSAALAATGAVQAQQAVQQALSAVVTATRTLRRDGTVVVTALLTLLGQARARSQGRRQGSLGSTGRLARRASWGGGGSLVATALAGVQRVIVAPVTAMLSGSAAARAQGRVSRQAVVLSRTTVQYAVRVRVAATLLAGGRTLRQGTARLQAWCAGVAATAPQKVATWTISRAVTPTGLVRTLAGKLAQALIALLGILDLINEWSGWIPGEGRVVPRWNATATLVSRAPTAQLRTIPGTGAVQHMPSSGTLRA